MCDRTSVTGLEGARPVAPNVCATPAVPRADYNNDRVRILLMTRTNLQARGTPWNKYNYTRQTSLKPRAYPNERVSGVALLAAVAARPHGAGLASYLNGQQEFEARDIHFNPPGLPGVQGPEIARSPVLGRDEQGKVTCRSGRRARGEHPARRNGHCPDREAWDPAPPRRRYRIA